jgi:hypothetical protein
MTAQCGRGLVATFQLWGVTGGAPGVGHLLHTKEPNTEPRTTS